MLCEVRLRCNWGINPATYSWRFRLQASSWPGSWIGASDAFSSPREIAGKGHKLNQTILLFRPL